LPQNKAIVGPWTRGGEKGGGKPCGCETAHVRRFFCFRFFRYYIFSFCHFLGSCLTCHTSREQVAGGSPRQAA